MARPTLPTISSGLAGWDALVDDAFDTLTIRPFPVATVVDLATLNASFAPGLYEWCLVVVQTPTPTLYTSNGAAWVAL